MKILKREQNYKFNEETNEMIPDGLINDVKANVPLTFEAMDYKHIELDGENIIIPYADQELKKAIGFLCYEISEETDWQFPDLEKTRMALYIDVFENQFKAMIYIMVQPPVYSEQKMNEILSTATKDEPFNDGWNQYENWQNVFLYSADWHATNDENNDYAEADFFEIEFEPDEQSELKWFLIQHLTMHNFGGKYA